MDLVHIIDGLIGVLVLGFGYWASTLSGEVKRIEILLNRTREDFCTRAELSDNLTRMSDSILRLEAKIDRIISSK
jgi:non-ribosomal peptide synthetase component F|tara:strand:+ start:1401 stop:1625 length:225 start_codon:yes stop_codon:yes gene_type:complete